MEEDKGMGRRISLMFGSISRIFSKHKEAEPQTAEAPRLIETLRKSTPLPIEFQYEELEFATSGFETVIGRGGFGAVYKGLFRHYTDLIDIAVKQVIANDGDEVEEQQFRREMTTIASLQHFNISRLLGYCYVPGRYRFLVYEFMSNGSLDRWIFNEDIKCCLSWDCRYRVAVQVAKALKYMHHDCHDKILHLDIKPENILLDDELLAHLTDFGLSRLMGRNQTSLKTKGGGTLAYMGPEYILLHNYVSEKADIYGYGMMLLELVHGERNVPHEMAEYVDTLKTGSYYPKIVSQRMSEGRLMEVVDKRLFTLGEVNATEVDVLVSIALWCIQEKPEDRPSMEDVVEMLERKIVPDKPPETRMLMMELLFNGPESLQDLPTSGKTEHQVFDAKIISTITSQVAWRLMFAGDDNANMMFVQTVPMVGEAITNIEELAWLPKKFTYAELQQATSNFSIPIRKDGFTFAGKLSAGNRQVIVKRIMDAKKDFEIKISRIVGLQHFYLVRVIGYCIGAGKVNDLERGHFLVYDCMPNGSLDTWIFKANDPNRCLEWNLRYQVAIDVAKALEYLLHDCGTKTDRLLLNIEAETIWLDKSFRAHLMDYDSLLSVPKTEYEFDGWDVGPYGFLLLEMVTARRSSDVYYKVPNLFDFQRKEKPRIKANVMEMVDERLRFAGGGTDRAQLDLLVRLALSCIQSYSARPTMRVVIDVLEDRIPSDVLTRY